MATIQPSAAAMPPIASVARGDARAGVVEWLARAHVVAALCLLTGLFFTFASRAAGAPAGFEDRQSGTGLLQAVGLAVYLPTLLFLIARPEAAIRTLPRAWLLLLLQALIVLSAWWAVEPDAAARRVTALSIEMLFVWHVATWFTARDFIRLMSWTIGAMLVASLLAVGIPGLGITPGGTHAGKLRGIFPSKNILGEVAGVGAICFVTMAAIARTARHRAGWIAMAGLALLALLLANSRTPLVSLVAALAAMWCAGFIAFPRGWQRSLALSVRVALVSAGTLLVVVILPGLFALVITALGRTMTLSGRTKLWEYAIDKGWDRPWLGAGYKSFWNDKLTFDLRVLHEHWSEGSGAKALTANAHNGYIDTWLELGFVGLAVMLLLLAAFGVKAARALRQTRDPVHLWHVGVLAFVLVYYVTESGVMGYNDLAWFLVAYGFLSLCAREVAARRPAAALQRA